ncbi:MAG: hypothetical protein J6V90_08375 [Treponema sp.]|nr:hypothetical protein [Treponema sp.]
MRKNGKDYDDGYSFLRSVAGAIIAFVVLCLVSAFCLCIGGCATTKSHSGGVRESSSFIVGKLEGSVEDFDRGIARAVERSRSIEDELERLDYLFGQYEQTALRLRDQVDSLRAEIERLEKIRDDSGFASASVHSD